MHRRRFHRGRPPLGARFYARENVLERLDEYQRDLEQELADVTELIRRLRAEEAAQAATRAPVDLGRGTPGQARTIYRGLHCTASGIFARAAIRSADCRGRGRKRLPASLQRDQCVAAASRSRFVSSITFWEMCEGTSS